MFDGLKPTRVEAAGFRLVTISAERAGGTITFEVPDVPARGNLVQTSYCVAGGFAMIRNGVYWGDYMPGEFSSDRVGPVMTGELVYAALSRASQYVCVSTAHYTPYTRRRFDTAAGEIRRVPPGHTLALMDGSISIAGKVIAAPNFVTALLKPVFFEGVTQCRALLVAHI